MGKNKKKNKEIVIPAKKIITPQKINKSEDGIKSYLPYLLIILVNVVIFGKSLFFNFIDLDDLINIVENNPYFKDFSNFFYGFKVSYIGSFYRPLLWGSWILDCQFGGNQPFFYHFSNLVYHILVCCLMYKFIILLKYDKKISLIIVLIFAVHPLFNQAIGWIPGRNDTILLIFILLSFIHFVKILDTSNPKNYLFHFIFLSLALFTKETAIAIPLLCFIFSFTIYKPNNSNFKIFNWKLIFAWGLIIVIWYLIRENALHSGILKNLNVEDNGKYFVRSTNEIKGLDAFSENFSFLFESFGKLIFPIHLSNYAAFDNTQFILGIVFYIIFIISLFLLKVPFKKIFFYFCWWFVFLIPPMLLYFEDGRYDYLEHRIYTPAIGIFILLIEIAQKFSFKIIRIIGIIIIIILSAFSFIRIDIFDNRESFFKAAIKSSPYKVNPYRILGHYYEGIGDNNNAFNMYKELIKNNPTQMDIISHIASQYLKKGKLDSALIYFNLGFNLNKPDYDLYTTFADYLDKQHKTDSAILLYKKAIELKPNNFIPYHNIAFIALQKLELDTAEKYFLKVLSLDPNQINSLSEIGVVYIKKGNLNEALKYLTKAIEVQPNYSEAYFNLLNVYKYLNDQKKIQELTTQAKKNGINF